MVGTTKSIDQHVPLDKAGAPNRKFENVEQVRDALLCDGVLMQVFNSNLDLEWKYIRFLRPDAGKTGPNDRGQQAPNQIQLVSPQTNSSMKFLLSELEHVDRGANAMFISDEIAQAARTQVPNPEERLAAFIFGQDGSLIIIFPDRELADQCCRAFKTFGIEVN